MQGVGWGRLLQALATLVGQYTFHRCPLPCCYLCFVPRRSPEASGPYPPPAVLEGLTAAIRVKLSSSPHSWLQEMRLATPPWVL